MNAQKSTPRKARSSKVGRIVLSTLLACLLFTGTAAAQLPSLGGIDERLDTPAGSISAQQSETDFRACADLNSPALPQLPTPPVPVPLPVSPSMANGLHADGCVDGGLDGTSIDASAGHPLAGEISADADADTSPAASFIGKAKAFVESLLGGLF